jgi:small multidrug resistance pump
MRNFRAARFSGLFQRSGLRYPEDTTSLPETSEAAMPVHYIYLIVAVAAETIGTTALQASQQFSRLVPSLIVLVAYGFSFYMLGLTLKVMPVGIVYAIWSGLGIVLIAVIGLVVFGQKLDLPAVLGMAMILAGILVIHLFSGSSGH